MNTTAKPAHSLTIVDQFTRQATGFAAGRELHADDVVALVVDAADPAPGDRAIDLACGPGSVACGLARRAAAVVGLDATPAMLNEARALAGRLGLTNIEWVPGEIYAVPCPDAAFDVVTCRFAFHHLEDPTAAFREMTRVAAPGGRIVLCDGLASDDPAKAAAFNAMERWRDPSTVEFRTLDFLRGLFVGAGLGQPEIRRFHVPYLAADLVRGSFPAGDDRAGLLAHIEASAETDALAMGAARDAHGVVIAYASAVLTAVKPR